MTRNGREMRITTITTRLGESVFKRQFQKGIDPIVDHRLLRPLGPFAI